MALKQARPGVYYDDQAEGAQVAKLVFKDSGAPAKALLANGVCTKIDTRDALALTVTRACQAVKSDGSVCTRDLPCRYHG